MSPAYWPEARERRPCSRLDLTSGICLRKRGHINGLVERANGMMLTIIITFYYLSEFFSFSFYFFFIRWRFCLFCYAFFLQPKENLLRLLLHQILIFYRTTHHHQQIINWVQQLRLCNFL